MIKGLISSVWSTGSEVARGMAHAGFLKSVKLETRVVSVGNIQVGGAGKTPLVARIANEASERGLKACILCRGYKSTWEWRGGVLAPGDSGVRASECGDEAALLHELSPQAYIGVGANRLRQYNKILEKSESPIDLVILDDGFQNWRIQKDLEIVALTSARPGQVLFRDSPSALRHADLKVWTKGRQNPIDSEEMSNSGVRVQYQLPSPKTSDSHWFVTGIADGQSAYELALQSGYQIKRHLSFMDHARYHRSSIRQIMKQASAEGCRVALTGKDWVKWRELGVTQSEVLILEPQLIFEEGRETWLQVLWGESFT